MNQEYVMVFPRGRGDTLDIKRQGGAKDFWGGLKFTIWELFWVRKVWQVIFWGVVCKNDYRYLIWESILR